MLFNRAWRAVFRPAHYGPELGGLPTRAAAVALRTAHLAFPFCEELMDLLFLEDGHLAALAEATTMDSSFFRLPFLAARRHSAKPC